MGVPFYFFHICRKYKHHNILIDTDDIQADILYFDYNSLIHPCVHEALNKQESSATSIDLDELIIQECLRYTSVIIDTIKPSQSVVIAIDGVAPRAKMNQQRERRFKSAMIDKKTWDTNQITPGTPFMMKLKEKLEEYIRNLPYNCILSAADEVGEGEHKIMQMISSSNANVRHCIYGLDADLIMLSMLNDKRNNIMLFRDNISKYERYHASRFQCLNISKLCHCLALDLLDGDTNIARNEYLQQRVIRDYVYLCFLFGNDFIPGVPSLFITRNGVHHIIDAYKRCIRMWNPQKLNPSSTFLIKDGYSYSGFDNIINFNLFLDILKSINQQCTDFQQIQLKETPVEKKSIWYYTKDFIKDEKGTYYKYFGMEQNVNDAVLAYLKTLHWTYGYYNGHAHDNWRWHYSYEVAPLLVDIIQSMKSNQFSVQKITVEKDEPYTPIQQLLLVLPHETLKHVLEKIDSSLFERYSSFMNTCTFEYFHPTKMMTIDCWKKEFLWQAKPILSHIPDAYLETLM